MAGDWIKLEHSTPDKPEIVRMAQLLEMDQDAVCGKCLRVWIWADQQTVDGNALSVTDAFLDRLTFCPGFAVALRKVGWLSGREGHLTVPNFDRHNGQTAKKRALSKDRTQKSRNAPSVTDALPEKRREEKSIKKKTTSSKKESIEIPDGLNTPEFVTAWDRWKTHRTEIKKRLTPTQTASQLKKLEGWGIARALAAIDHSITNGWQGLFEPDGNRGVSRPGSVESDTDWGALE